MVMLYKGQDKCESNSNGASIDSRQLAERSLDSELSKRDKQINELKAEIAVLKGQLSEIEIILSTA